MGHAVPALLRAGIQGSRRELVAARGEGHGSRSTDARSTGRVGLHRRPAAGLAAHHPRTHRRDRLRAGGLLGQRAGRAAVRGAADHPGDEWSRRRSGRAAGDQPRHSRDSAAAHQRAALPGARPTLAGDRPCRAAQVGTGGGRPDADRRRRTGVQARRHRVRGLLDVRDGPRRRRVGPDPPDRLWRGCPPVGRSESHQGIVGVRQFAGAQGVLLRAAGPGPAAGAGRLLVGDRRPRRRARRDAGPGGAAGLGRPRPAAPPRADRPAPGPHRRLSRHRGAGPCPTHPAKRLC